ncbi:MAG: ribonuclease E/G [Rhodospirillales bacterium]|nr:ribonuclease E/G [Rhodospirillales bacterium]
MTIDTILAETTPRAMRIALMAGDSLAELHIDRPPDRHIDPHTPGHRAGDVVAGRVTRVVPGLKAAFVDIGQGVTGFLRARDADREGSGARIETLVQEGGCVAVAIGTDARDGKGPVLTRRFADPDGAVAAAAMRADPPALLSRREPLLLRLCRVYPEAQVVADSPADAAALRRAELPGGIRLHRGTEPLFEGAGIEEQIERALGPDVALSSGAVLRFDRTRALTAVDVDSAAASEAGAPPAALNLDAVPVLAHQLRLRNLGGLVIVDFLNMDNRADGKRLVAALARALRDDPARTALDGPSRFGLVELARQRLGPTLAEAMGSPVEAAAEALVRRVRREAHIEGGAALRIRASPEVASAFRGAHRGQDIAHWIGRRLELVSDPGRPHHDTEVAPLFQGPGGSRSARSTL